MKKTIVFSSVLLSFLLLSTPALAASTDVSKIQTFMQSVIQVLVTLAGLISAGFFVWGGIGYITSSGDPEKLDKAKKTIVYSAIGLVIVLGAFVISTIVTQLATGAFGGSTQ